MTQESVDYIIDVPELVGIDMAKLGEVSLEDLDTESPVLRVGRHLVFHGRHATYIGTAMVVDASLGSMSVAGLTRRRVVFKLVEGDISKAVDSVTAQTS